MELLSEVEFLDVLRVEFEGELPPEAIEPEAHLIGDLDLDSLDLIRIVAVVESLAPIDIPEDLPVDDATIRDLFHYYEVAATRLPDAAR